MSEEETAHFPDEGSLEDREEKQPDDVYDYQQGFPYPEQIVKESLFKFLRDILRIKDSTKVANLSNTDLHNVRLYNDTALYLDQEGCKEIADYFRAMSENVLSTSMSRGGFFMTTAVTQVRKVQRVSGTKTEEEKKGLFSSWKKKKSGEEVEMT